MGLPEGGAEAVHETAAAGSDSSAAARLLLAFIERRSQKAEQHFAVAVLVAQAVEHVVEREFTHASRSEAVGQIGNDVRVVFVDFDEAVYYVLDLLRLAQARCGSLGGRQSLGAASQYSRKWLNTWCMLTFIFSQ